MNRRKNSGTTLIEVVVGLSLLGSLLVALIVVASKLDTQRKATEQKQIAIQVLDQVLSKGFSRGFPPANTIVPAQADSEWDFTVNILENQSLVPPLLIARIAVTRRGNSDDIVSFVDVIVHRENLGSSSW